MRYRQVIDGSISVPLPDEPAGRARVFGEVAAAWSTMLSAIDHLLPAGAGCQGGPCGQKDTQAAGEGAMTLRDHESVIHKCRPPHWGADFAVWPRERGVSKQAWSGSPLLRTKRPRAAMGRIVV